MSRARTAALLLRRTLLVAALLGLVLGVGHQPPSPGGPAQRLHVVVAVDVTTSMAALDGDDEAAPRLAVAAQDVTRLVDALVGARISLVTFGQEASIRVPFTPDSAVLQRAAQNLTVESPQLGSGSRVDAALPLLTSQVEQAEQGVVPPVEVRTAVIYLGDGENTAAQQPASFADLGTATDAALVLGYGTADGAPMPLDPSSVLPVSRQPDDPGIDPTTLPTIPAPDGSGPGISRMDAARLQTIADELGADFAQRDSRTDLESLASDLEQEATAGRAPPPRPGRNVGWLWALAVLVLLLPEVTRWTRMLAETRRPT